MDGGALVYSSTNIEWGKIANLALKIFSMAEFQLNAVFMVCYQHWIAPYISKLCSPTQKEYTTYFIQYCSVGEI
jgi:hypothetical protein